MTALITRLPRRPARRPARRAAELPRLCRLLERRDPASYAHCRRVADSAAGIAAELGLSRRRTAVFYAAALLHDLGKLKVPRWILDKPGGLTPAEYELVKLHAAAGARMVAGLGCEELTAIVRHHHERFDGRGYPDRLEGEEIPLGARVLAVADSYDALVTARPYRLAASAHQACALIDYAAGTQFDPEAVAAFHRAAGREPPPSLAAARAQARRTPPPATAVPIRLAAG